MNVGKDIISMKSEQQVNDERQKDEILALSQIYSFKEFSYTKDFTQCYYNVFPKIKEGLLKLQTLNTSDISTGKHSLACQYFIKYLPPLRMYIHLPVDYPTKSSPNFYVTTSWLSSWKISMICQKLDEIWLTNRGQEILFLWFEFLRNDLLNFLCIEHALDISFLYMAYYNISSYFNLNLSYKHDTRAIYNTLFLDPLQFLISYDGQQQENMFKHSYYTCIICFETFLGEKCIKFENCDHVYCSQCIEQYIASKINENNVCSINCPTLSCNTPIAVHEIKSLCQNLFSKYDDTLLNITLKTIKNLITCPRKSCQFSFIKDTDEELTICYKCNYTFCSYCYKGYHGATPCIIPSIDIEELIQEYESSDKHQKQLLEKKYGRKHIQITVEKHLTEKYLEKFTKPCPNCQTMIEKFDGCNKMTCLYCSAKFCWLCGTHITTSNAYEHFLSGTNLCYKRLFDP